MEKLNQRSTYFMAKLNLIGKLIEAVAATEDEDEDALYQGGDRAR